MLTHQPNPPSTRHTIGRHSVNMEATGTPRTAGHPGLLILDRVRLLILDCLSWTTHPGAQIFPVPGPALFSHTRYGSSIPVALWWILDSVRRCGGSWTTHPVRWIPHPGGSLIRWTIHPGTSWTRTGTPHPAHPVRWILDHPGTSWTVAHPGRWLTVAHPGPSRWIPMDPHSVVYTNTPPRWTDRAGDEGGGRIRCLCPNHTKRPQRF